MIGWSGLFGIPNEPTPNPTAEQRAEVEKKRPHTYKCNSCEVSWVDKGLEPQPCFCCGTDITPNCSHG